ncbi:MAG TPA: urease accessory UreF family protein [Pseudonocardiaceae bacterium]|nr:urease accessory UreF family protein [Pseudonocardiaceae bacterium]
MTENLPRVPETHWLSGFLAVLQLADSAFPSGRYTLSYGLETFAQTGRLTTPAEPSELAGLLRDYLALSVAPSEGVALACAHRAASTADCLDLDLVGRTDARLTAVKLSKESRDTSTRTGRALLRVAKAVFRSEAIAEYAGYVESGLMPGNHAVVLGILSASLGVTRVESVTGELFAFAASWVAAAVRLAVTDHGTAQALLYDVHEDIADAAVASVGKNVGDIASYTPLLDVMGMRHEQTELRLFAS